MKPEFNNNAWQEFCKLYKLQIPSFQHANYYLEVLGRCPGYAWIPQRLFEFQDLVSKLRAQDQTPTDYKFKQMQGLVEWFKQSPALKALEGVRRPADVSEFDKLHSATPDQICASIDLKQANYNTWRRFDQTLPSTWEELMLQQQVHPAIGNSKSFRQIVFGNLNPKRLQQAQAAETYKIKLLMESEATQAIRWSADEVTFAVHRSHVSKFSDDYTSKVDKNPEILPSRLVFYELQPIPELGSRQTFYRFNSNGVLVANHSELFGVPGNLMYLALKEHILHEPVQMEDLLFRMEGRNAYWDHPMLHQASHKT